jgi:hypothetical protein
VQSSSPIPIHGIASSKCRKNRRIETFVSKSTPMVIPSTAWITVRAGSSNWYSQRRGTMCHIMKT